MKNILIISSTENSGKLFEDLVLQAFPDAVTYAAETASKARELILEKRFFLCLINVPLYDEIGDGFAFKLAEVGTCQVILVVKKQVYEDVLFTAEQAGVFLVAKPIVRSAMTATLLAAKVCAARMERLESENKRLSLKIDEIRLVDRAKLLLIEVLKMTEQDAHRYIEKQAMDMRRPKKEIAERIVKTYGL